MGRLACNKPAEIWPELFVFVYGNDSAVNFAALADYDRLNVVCTAKQASHLDAAVDSSGLYLGLSALAPFNTKGRGFHKKAAAILRPDMLQLMANHAGCLGFRV